jgi:hypothetical protein
LRPKRSALRDEGGIRDAAHSLERRRKSPVGQSARPIIGDVNISASGTETALPPVARNKVIAKHRRASFVLLGSVRPGIRHQLRHAHAQQPPADEKSERQQ